MRASKDRLLFQAWCVFSWKAIMWLNMFSVNDSMLRKGSNLLGMLLETVIMATECGDGNMRVRAAIKLLASVMGLFDPRNHAVSGVVNEESVMKKDILKNAGWALLLFSLVLHGVASAATGALGIRLVPVFESLRLERPLLLLEAPASTTSMSRTWFVVEQAGRVLRVQQTGAKLNQNEFIDLRHRVESGPNEAGLLGMALDPQFAHNGRVYLSYTREDSPLVSVLSRYYSRDGGQTLDAGSEQVLLEVKQPYSNHNGGNLQFGVDGYLYYGLGDGGSAGDPKGNGQNRNTLLGAMLRLDVSGEGAYHVPADNPFVGKDGLPEIYAYGLRNPWRWSFDRKTGEMWLADVGQNAWEEVNIVSPGANYGWNIREGAHCYSGDCRRADLQDPVAEYSHAEGCSITGGYVYRGEHIPALAGVYLFADFCSGKIWGLFSTGENYTRRLLLETDLNIASFAEDQAGEVYVVALGGKIFRLSAGSRQ
jgi:glucose/arabinose dehydrogenase